MPAKFVVDDLSNICMWCYTGMLEFFWGGGRQVVMQHATAARRRHLIRQNLEGQLPPPLPPRTLFGKQAKSSKRVENSMSWIFMKLIWGVHMHLLYHVQCTKTIFIAWFGCRSSESTAKFTRSGWIYLMKLAYCSKSLLTSQIRQNFNSSVS